MKFTFAFLASLLLTSSSSLILEYLIHTRDYPSYFVLFIRGVIGFILCTSLAYSKGMRAFPEKWNLQRYRLVNSGIILLLLFESYKHLSATTVSLFQRLDIPFLIILSVFIRDKKSKVQLVFSIITILSIVYFVSSNLLTEEQETNGATDYYGFILAGGAAFLLAFSYVLLKKTSQIDNAFVIANITCISTAIFGLVTTLINGYNFTININDIWAFLLVGIILVASYYYSMELYKQFHSELAQLPSVLAVVLTMAIEMVIKHKWVKTSEIIVIVFLVLLTTVIAININFKKLFQKRIFVNEKNKLNETIL